MQSGLKDVAGTRVEKNEVNGFERGLALQVLKRFSEHDLRALVHGKTGDTGADSGKSDGFEIALSGEAEGVRRGGPKCFRSGAHAAEAHAGRMDDVSSFQFAATGDRRVPDRDAADVVALALDGFATLAGDGAGHACAEDQVVVSRVDDGVHVHFGQVALLDEDAVDGGSHVGSLRHLGWGRVVDSVEKEKKGT